MPTKPVIESKQCSEKGITKALSKKSWNHVKVTGVFQSVQVGDEGRGDSGAKTGAWFCGF